MNDPNLGGSLSGSRPEAASGFVENIKQQAGEASDKARAKIDSARQPVADKLHAAADAVRGQADRLPCGEAVSGAAQTAANKLDASATYLESHDTRQIVNDGLAVVKRYPVQAMLIAGAFGFLIARALRNTD